MLCENCGKEIECTFDNYKTKGERSWFITLILSWFTGVFGLHRFYTGYVGIGIAQFLTLGGLGIWALVDFILICTGEYKTKEDKPLTGYVKSLGIASIFIYLIPVASHYMMNVITGIIKAYIK